MYPPVVRKPSPCATQGPTIDQPPLDPHRWTPPRGLTPLDAGTRELLHRLRGRRLSADRAPHRITLILVLLLHGLFAVVLWHAMQPGPAKTFTVSAPASHERALQVRFIPRARTVTETKPPALRAPPPPAEPPRPVREATRSDAMTASLPASASSSPPPLRLFDRDGAVQLAPAAPATAAQPGYVQRKPTGDMQVMQHTTPVPYKATRFEQYFPPPGENAGQAGLRKVMAPLFKQHAVRLPRGVHLKCSLLGGCSDPPAPPPPNDGDERLNMAPAAPLAADPHPPKPPALASCIAAWRSQGPLPYGCPTDTPARAVAEEVRECVELFRAGKRLKTWCPADTARRAEAAPGSP